jgi:hypothetical protein
MKAGLAFIYSLRCTDQSGDNDIDIRKNIRKVIIVPATG